MSILWEFTAESSLRCAIERMSVMKSQIAVPRLVRRVVVLRSALCSWTPKGLCPKPSTTAALRFSAEVHDHLCYIVDSDGQISKLNNTLKKAEKKCLAENSIGMSILALCHTISVRWVWRWLLQDSDHHEDECVMMRRQSRFESSAMLDRFWGTAKRSNNLRHLLELEEELREISGEPVAGWEWGAWGSVRFKIDERERTIKNLGDGLWMLLTGI